MVFEVDALLRAVSAAPSSDAVRWMAYELLRQRHLLEPVGSCQRGCSPGARPPRCVTYFILWTPAEAVPAAEARAKNALPFMIADVWVDEESDGRW